MALMHSKPDSKRLSLSKPCELTDAVACLIGCQCNSIHENTNVIVNEQLVTLMVGIEPLLLHFSRNIEQKEVFCGVVSQESLQTGPAAFDSCCSKGEY